MKVLKLAGNAGAFNAMFCGIEHATGDALVLVMADLQDPPELMVNMLDYWRKGLKVVIANRSERGETAMQKWVSNTFHGMVRRYALKQAPPCGFDYVLFHRQVRNEIVAIREPNADIFYLISWLNFPYVSIPYTRKKREVGKSRWTLKKKIKAFIDTFVGFSFAPIRLTTVTGFVLGIIALLAALIISVARIAGWIDMPGWSSLMVVLLFVSALQMLALGIIGEYVWRALDASRKHPLYVVDKKHGG